MECFVEFDKVLFYKPAKFHALLLPMQPVKRIIMASGKLIIDCRKPRISLLSKTCAFEQLVRHALKRRHNDNNTLAFRLMKHDPGNILDAFRCRNRRPAKLHHLHCGFSSTKVLEILVEEFGNAPRIFFASDFHHIMVPGTRDKPEFLWLIGGFVHAL